MLRARLLQGRLASPSHRPAAATAQPDASLLFPAACFRLAAWHCQPYAATASQCDLGGDIIEILHGDGRVPKHVSCRMVCMSQAAALELQLGE